MNHIIFYSLLTIIFILSEFCISKSPEKRIPLFSVRVLSSIIITELIFFYIGFLGLARNYIYFSEVGIGLVLAGITVRQAKNFDFGRVKAQLFNHKKFLIILICYEAIAFLIGRSFPDESWDASMYHNPVSLLFSRGDSLARWPDLNPWEWFPSSIDALRSLGALPLSSISNSMFNMFFVVLMIYAVVEKFQIQGKIPLVLISLAPFALPVMVSQIPTAYIDIVFSSLIAIILLHILNIDLKPGMLNTKFDYVSLILVSSFIASSKWTGVGLLFLVILAKYSYIFFVYQKDFDLQQKLKLTNIFLTRLLSPVLIGIGLGLIPWLIRNSREGHSILFPMSIFGASDTPYTFQNFETIASMQNRSINGDVTHLNSFGDIRLIFYQYLQTPFDYVIRAIRFLWGERSTTNQRWLYIASNYDARLGGFFLASTFIFFLSLFLFLTRKLRRKKFWLGGNTNQSRELLATSMVTVALGFIVSKVGWYPRYWVGFAWLSCFILLLNFLNHQNAKFKLFVISTFALLVVISIGTSAASNLTPNRDTFRGAGYAGPLIEAKRSLLQGRSCDSTLIVGYQLQFPTALLVPPCSKFVQNVVLDSSTNVERQFGNMRPNYGRKLIDGKQLLQIIKNQHGKRLLLIVADHDLDRLNQYSTYISKLLSSESGLTTEIRRVSEPYLTKLDLFLIQSV